MDGVQLCPKLWNVTGTEPDTRYSDEERFYSVTTAIRERVQCDPNSHWAFSGREGNSRGKQAESRKWESTKTGHGGCWLM